jgi:tRNA pseudouridine55 synthase
MDGILLIDKASGISSFGVIRKLRRILGVKKIGHAGTLDPLATGLLVILVGKACKQSAEFTGHDKVYEADIALGRSTTTDDAEGELLAEGVVPDWQQAELLKVLQGFVGEQLQIPPNFSAISVAGKRAYKMARQGEVFELAARTIRIHKIELLAFESPMLKIRVGCSKGTYIRALARDIGARLGCPAHLAGLRRTQSGSFKIEEAFSLETLSTMRPEEIEQAFIKNSLG